MPRLPDIPQVASPLQGNDTVLGVRDTTVGLFPAVLFQGRSGNTIITGTGVPGNTIGIDGDYYFDPTAQLMYGPKASGVWPAGVSVKGATGNTVLSGSGTPSNTLGVDGDFYYDPAAKKMFGPKASGVWPAGVVLGDGGSLIDNSGATSDLLLNPGESAFVSYISATSIPLHIQTTSSGVYDLEIIGDLSNTGGADTAAGLYPNNSGISTDFRIIYRHNTGGGDASGTNTGFLLGGGLVMGATLKVYTFTTNKTLRGSIHTLQSSSFTYLYEVLAIWNDVSTPWTSLGTLTFDTAQSGMAVIHRIQ